MSPIISYSGGKQNKGAEAEAGTGDRYRFCGCPKIKVFRIPGRFGTGDRYRFLRRFKSKNPISFGVVRNRSDGERMLLFEIRSIKRFAKPVPVPRSKPPSAPRSASCSALKPVPVPRSGTPPARRKTGTCPPFQTSISAPFGFLFGAEPGTCPPFQRVPVPAAPPRPCGRGCAFPPVVR